MKNEKAATPKKQTYRYQLVLEYDGTNFSGWQRQRDARTVQGDCIKAIKRLIGRDFLDLQGCGRTDAGVHALAYSAHMETGLALDDEDFFFHTLNEELPKDIALLELAQVESRFHARHSCCGRSYVYRLGLRKSAFGKRYSWWYKDDLDLELMKQAASEMTGMHDFAAFAEKPELKKLRKLKGNSKQSTRVLVNAIRFFEDDEGLMIQVVASHFLWHMVRRMVGVLVAVGSGRMTRGELRQLLASQTPVGGYLTAPAAGLFFERAFYDPAELQEFVATDETQ